MFSDLPQTPDLMIRAIAYRDIEAVERLFADHGCHVATGAGDRPLGNLHQWYAPLQLLNILPGPSPLRVYVAEKADRLLAAIRVAPFNDSRSTWQVEQLAVMGEDGEVGTQLLRHCFSHILEARTWVLEVNIQNRFALSLYRQNGFQPLAQLTYWALSAAQLVTLAEHQPNLPNLLSVTNADAALLCQLDTAAMPALVRQVFDRHNRDFKMGFLDWCRQGLQEWGGTTHLLRAYVFEPQRKAAIGYYALRYCQDGSHPHWAELTVHPAYTWLYPELLAQLAGLVRSLPANELHLASTDYQPEREAYLEDIGAERMGHSLMMSRSVWHKVREVRSPLPEGLTLSEVLQGFQPSHRPGPMATPHPHRFDPHQQSQKPE